MVIDLESDLHGVAALGPVREAVRRRLRGVPPDSVEASMPIRPSDDATYSESGFNKVSLNDMYMLSF